MPSLYFEEAELRGYARRNIFLPDQSAKIWFVFTPVGEDLCLEELEYADDAGDRHAWVGDEIDSCGWEGIFGLPSRTVESGLGWCFVETNRRWALENRIAPNQPFLIHVQKPIWSTDYYGESDVDYNWDLVRVAKISSEIFKKRWERENKRVDKIRSRMLNSMAELKKKRTEDVSSMYIYSDGYWVNGNSWTPNGILIRLCSSHTKVENSGKYSWPEIAEGRDDGGSYNKAWKNLLENVQKILPNLTEDQIKNLLLVRLLKSFEFNGKNCHC